MSIESGLAGKVVVVTGGSRGIGRAVVELFAAEGADVTFFYRQGEQAADEVVAAASKAGQMVTADRVDVTDPEACESGIERIVDRCERAHAGRSNRVRSMAPLAHRARPPGLRDAQLPGSARGYQ